MMINDITELIGKTPLVRLNKINPNIYAKLEKGNPAGSIKDRAVLGIIKDYQSKGLIHEGSTLIEPTSGNTGIALACLSNYFGYRCIIVMPESMSVQRRELIKAYGAELVLVKGGMSECEAKAKELLKEIPGSLIFGQFDNPANKLAHYLTTGPEILEDLPDVDVIVAGFGTGGTISGIGRYFKEHKPGVEIIGVEPESSPLVSKGIAGPHKIQGIGANFVPNNLDLSYIDRIETVNDEDAINMARTIVKKEGYLVGISSGAALSKALEISNREEYEGKKIVVIFPDTGERYSWN